MTKKQKIINTSLENSPKSILNKDNSFKKIKKNTIIDNKKVTFDKTSSPNQKAIPKNKVLIKNIVDISSNSEEDSNECFDWIDHFEVIFDESPEVLKPSSVVIEEVNDEEAKKVINEKNRKRAAENCAENGSKKVAVKKAKLSPHKEPEESNTNGLTSPESKSASKSKKKKKKAKKMTVEMRQLMQTNEFNLYMDRLNELASRSVYVYPIPKLCCHENIRQVLPAITGCHIPVNSDRNETLRYAFLQFTSPNEAKHHVQLLQSAGQIADGTDNFFTRLNAICFRPEETANSANEAAAAAWETAANQNAAKETGANPKAAGDQKKAKQTKSGSNLKVRVCPVNWVEKITKAGLDVNGLDLLSLNVDGLPLLEPRVLRASLKSIFPQAVKIFLPALKGRSLGHAKVVFDNCTVCKKMFVKTHNMVMSGSLISVNYPKKAKI